jgi:hypothetical protein
MKTRLSIFLLFLVVLLTACGGTTAPVSPTIDPALEVEVSGAATDMAENLIASINNSNHTVFLVNMDQVMIDAMTEEAFSQIQALIGNRIGAYQSLSLENLSAGQGYYIANFILTGDLGTTPMRLVLYMDSPYLITGLWFPD